MPKVSVIFTSFNHAQHIGVAIDSVLNQSFTDFELLILDDCSADNSWELIQHYTDPRIKAFRNTTNKGPVEGINNAIAAQATGSYIAIHHSDDAWELDKLEKQVAYLDANPDIGAVFTWAQMIDEHGVKLDGDWFDQDNKSQWQWLKLLFIEINQLNHPSVLIRKPCYQEVGMYRHALAQSPDAEMWSRLLINYPIHVIPEKLTLHRLFSDRSNTSGNRLDVAIRLSNEWNVLRENYLAINREADWIALFPSLERFSNPHGFEPKFLLAMACLHECQQRNAWQLGIRLLFELLNDPVRRPLIAQYYGYGYLDLIKTTAAYDVYFAEADRAIAARDLVIAEQQARLDSLYASRSWRLTRPLRFISQWLHRP